MSDQIRESLSALMDGEAEEFELRKVLASDSESAVDNTWARYHMVRDVLLDDAQSSAFRHMDISSQVSMAIREEAHVSPDSNFEETANNQALGFGGAPSQVAAMPWWRPAAGFAVAASVAMAVVVGVQSLSPGLSISDPSMLSAANTAQNGQQTISTSRVYPVSGASMQASGNGKIARYGVTELPGDIAASRAAADLEAKKRLEKFMLRHTESAALNNGQGVISFARVASFESE